MKKNQFMNSKLVTFITALVLLFASCDNPIFDPGGDGKGGGKGNPKNPTDCSVKGTMVRIPCGTSIYNDLWIKTDDGKLLQPNEQVFMTPIPLAVHEGDRIEFGYAKSTSRIGKSGCNIQLPPHESIAILCLKVISSDHPVKTCPEIVIDHTNYGPNGIQILSSKLEGTLLKLKVGYGGCSAIESKDFSLSWKREISKSNPVQTTLQLFSPQVMKGNICDAYFTNELCYDLSSMMKDVELFGPILMHIGEVSVLLSK